jgi:aminoglycoside phosphotransferase (APT) family kinase protein
MTPTGSLIASGRDSDIYDFGPGKVLRRARGGRSLEREARLMEYVRARGYPVPEIHELRGGGSELVMERIDGPHLLDAVGAKPWKIGRMAGVLADLHARLHEIDAPADVPALDGDVAGTSLLHLDLHPLNVIMAARGPVVIDWPSAKRGHWALDVADTWLILAAGQPPASGLMLRIINHFRARFVEVFLSRFDLDAVRAVLPTAAARRSLDHNMSATEQAAMQRLVAEESSSAGRSPG